jgi:5-methylcytosine-specific restriction enzyme subunit McrC
LNKDKNHITIFEHETLHSDKGNNKIPAELLKSLQRYYGEGSPYFELCHNGVKFNEHVGVIQIGKTLIEVLPKADKHTSDKGEKEKWRSILIDMLRAVGAFDIKSTSQSHLKIKPNSILDLYFEMFIKEVEYLIHNGLVKKYRKNEGNVTALKGNLLFARHLQQNLTHQERFYVKHTTYDLEHKFHFILYKTIRLLVQINSDVTLQSRIGSLILNFQEMPDIKVSESVFSNLVFNRKTEIYRKAIEIARLILLNYHPDLNKGQNHVLALMFDMNKLWERFIYVSLKRFLEPDVQVNSQSSKNFWQPDFGAKTTIRPDIVMRFGDKNCLVLDTKWKNLNGSNPSPDDLRQMFVYHEYFDAQRVALVYPGTRTSEISGSFFPTPTNTASYRNCSVVTFAIPQTTSEGTNVVKEWQIQIQKHFYSWINTNT